MTFPYRAPKGDYVTRQDRYHTFRIPGMVVTGDGSILAFAEGRRGRGSDPTIDENAPIDMVLRRSTDQGRTWKAMQVIDSGFRPDGGRVDFADPTPVFDAMTQTVHLLYGQWPDRGPMVMKPGQSPDDEGKTFVNPVKFNDGFAAYSVLQRLSDGTIGLLAETSQEEGVRYGEISFHRFDIGELEQDTQR